MSTVFQIIYTLRYNILEIAASSTTRATVNTGSTSSESSQTAGTSTMIQSTSEGATILSTLIQTTPASNASVTKSSTQTPTATTIKQCEELQTVDQSTIKNITTTPTDLSDAEKAAFQPTSSQGVSFSFNNRAPTILIELVQPLEIQSITIPRDKTPSANVQQFEITFYSPDNKKINNRPIVTDLSPREDKTKPATLDASRIPSNVPVSRLEITIVLTTDSESPKGVILDIKICKEPMSSKYSYCSISFMPI